MLHGSINHVSLTLSNLDSALGFFKPFLTRLGYDVEDRAPGSPVVVCMSRYTGSALNLWQARSKHPFDVYEPGLHHIAFNVDSQAAVDEIAVLVPTIGGTVTDPPGEYGYTSVGTYYAVYFRGPDDIKLECVHMSELERLHREGGTLDRKLWPHEGG